MDARSDAMASTVMAGCTDRGLGDAHDADRRIVEGSNLPAGR